MGFWVSLTEHRNIAYIIVLLIRILLFQVIGSLSNTNQSHMQDQFGSETSLSVHVNSLYNTKTDVNLASDHVEDKDIFENFRMSTLHFDSQVSETRSDWFEYAAKNYKFKDKSFDELCEHNAKVALSFEKFNTYKDWMILKTIFVNFSFYFFKKIIFIDKNTFFSLAD